MSLWSRPSRRFLILYCERCRISSDGGASKRDRVIKAAVCRANAAPPASPARGVVAHRDPAVSADGGPIGSAHPAADRRALRESAAGATAPGSDRATSHGARRGRPAGIVAEAVAVAEPASAKGDAGRLRRRSLGKAGVGPDHPGETRDARRTGVSRRSRTGRGGCSGGRDRSRPAARPSPRRAGGSATARCRAGRRARASPPRPGGATAAG